MSDASDGRFSQERKNLYILWTGCFLCASSFSLVMPFLPRFISELGVKENLYAWAGWTYAVSFLASAIMSPIWGNLADRHGRKLMVIRSGLSITVIYLLMSLATNQYHLLGLRILNGVFAGFIPSAMALVATTTPEKQVGRALALVQTSLASGVILGPMIGGLLADLIGIRRTLIIGAILVLTATLMVIVGVREKRVATSKVKTSPLQDLKIAISHKSLLAVMVASMMVNASIQSLEPILTQYVPSLRQEAVLLWLTRSLFGRSDAHSFLAGFIFSLPALATLLTAARWARLGERIGYPKLLALGLGVAGLLALPQSLVTTAGGLIGLRFLYGAMTAAVYPAINATIATTVHPSFRGRAYGINTSALMLGSVIGPTLGGYVADGIGPRAVFVLTGLLLLLSCAWVYSAVASRNPNKPLVGTPVKRTE